jgi:hypothetical protein
MQKRTEICVGVSEREIGEQRSGREKGESRQSNDRVKSEEMVFRNQKQEGDKRKYKDVLENVDLDKFLLFWR